ncbi:sialate O-acetylesterase [Sabulilitoribacter arenilitoris]|uniref:Sialate O-acetylesterase n=1 Tax=Wocania arenilitoris TaxID=2044858 RepID=A0AAE3ESA6_9FLAO|nr:sialate O-acetylesterase [Wocania arenilitoris]MCF7569324.1 sialate O-acetylesterase [Wocania arenilitoris]
MRKHNLKQLFVIGFLLTIQSIYAEVKLPAIVSSDMVLQRNTTVVLWGWADANEDITIDASWLKEKLNIKADKNGDWRLEVITTNSKDAQTIKITSKESNITLNNILFGEVWLCSGQSNMRQTLAGYNGQPTFGSVLATANSNNPNLRLFTVERKGSKAPLKDVNEYKAWQQASPDNVLNFSAIAYFFGNQLQKILDVPVGMIHTSWGGSKVEAWISKDMITNYQTVNLDNVDIANRTNHIPTALFNAMINPLIPYTIKGALWYQGESNKNDPKGYKTLFPAMVKDWRSKWAIGDFPFYFVQIAPFNYGGNDKFEEKENSAFIREVQLQCADIIPNSGVAITMDLGEQYCIHPAKKKEVADRLLFNALNKTYGYKTIDFAGPEFDSKETKDGGLILKFKNAEGGLYAFNGLQGFEIAGADKVFYPAEAKIINGRNVFVKSDKVLNPIEVRYAWRNWVSGTLFDTSILPASSFRTDNWDDATHYKE